MLDQRLLILIGSLADLTERPHAAKKLAAALGAEDLVLFTKDSQMNVLLPAPGFPQTLPAGVKWHEFIASCVENRSAIASLVSPFTRQLTSAHGLASADGSVLVLLGGHPNLIAALSICALVPLLASALLAERVSIVAQGQVEAESAAATQADALARSLDKTRTLLEKALHKSRKTLSDLESERDLRDRFVATLTHDLRNPISAAKLSAQVLLRASDRSENERKGLNRILSNLDRADNMIQNLLDANRLQAGGGIPLQRVQCDLTSIVRDTVDEAKLRHGDRFAVSLDARVTAVANAHGIRRVLENLTDNAIKYGDPGTPVTVRLQQSHDQALISVHNQGPTLSAADQEKLFRQYFRGETAHLSGNRGWGIGLSIVKAIVEAHQGEVSVESETGKGTTFTVRIPLAMCETGHGIAL